MMTINEDKMRCQSKFLKFGQNQGFFLFHEIGFLTDDTNYNLLNAISDVNNCSLILVIHAISKSFNL